MLLCPSLCPFICLVFWASCKEEVFAFAFWIWFCICICIYICKMLSQRIRKANTSSLPTYRATLLRLTNLCWVALTKQSLQDGWGYDFRANMSVAWEEYGNYATDVFTREAVKVIEVRTTFHLLITDIFTFIWQLTYLICLACQFQSSLSWSWSRSWSWWVSWSGSCSWWPSLSGSWSDLVICLLE